MTIKSIRLLCNDSNSHMDHMNKGTLVGYLGELLVLQKLQSEGIEVTHLGNQKGVDLSCSSPFNSDIIRIDVKTSRLKDEFKVTGRRNWGWALNHKNKVKPITCTHFVCVQLNEALQPCGYVVIQKDLLNLFPPSYGQFKNVEHGLGLLEKTLLASCWIFSTVRYTRCDGTCGMALIFAAGFEGIRPR